LTGEKSLLRRPVGVLAACLRQLGVGCFTEKGDDYPPIIVMGGGIEGAEASLRGDESSQYVSALLFASPRARSAIRVKLSTPLESTPYVELTLRTLRRRGIRVDSSREMDNYSIHPGQSYQPLGVKISGDYSSASFILAAGVITRSKISVSNLTRDSGQADEKILRILGQMGVETSIESDVVSIVEAPGALSSIDVDVGDSPDLAPVLSVLACFAEGTSILRGAGRLRIKESDRLSALESELSKMGAKIKAKNDQLVIEGTRRLSVATIDSHGDHRIAMAGIVAGLAVDGVSQVLGAQTISKSYPNFLQDLRTLGAKLDVR
jgi:3-phosphoshikimate 1-carboxyvinyltransferase